MKKINTPPISLALLGNLPHIESQMDEEDSYWFLRTWQKEFNTSYRYDSNDIGFDITSFLANRFVMFCAKIDIPDKLTFYSSTPLSVFRYLMTEDLESWDYYTLTKKRPGYVVEGCHWSNGLLYQVREHSLDPLRVLQVVLFINKETKIVNKFPNIEDLVSVNENQNEENNR